MDMDSPATAERVAVGPARPVTLITGASSGIGAALAHVFAANGHEVVLAARREPQLATIGASIRAAGHRAPHILPVDLTRADSADWIAQELSARNLEPAFLVNNAGYGLLGPAATLDRADQLAMIDLNCRSLTDLSLRWINSLAHHRGFDRTAEDVARQGYRGLMRGRSVVVPGMHNKLVPWLPRFLPHGFIATMVYGRLRR